MYTLLSIAKAHHASDLHITVGVRPKCRISGTLYEMDGFEKLTPAMTKELVESMFNEKQKKTMEATGEVDFAYTDTRVGRFRVNAFHQRGSYAAVLRIVASDIPTPEDLGVPEAVLGLTKKKRGLVLVTGPTGSGKSTTLASLIDVINKERNEHIITLEDPIEYYKDGTYVDKIYKKDGTVIEGKATKENPKKYVFENLKNMSEYYFIYDTTGENKKKEGDIVFEIYNNKSKNPDGTPRVGKTTVKMESQNLFLLD